MTREDIFRLVNNELNETDIDKPKFNSIHEGYAVLKEEFDELWDEIKASKDFEANRMMVNEAVQVAAMAIKFIDNLYYANDDVFE